MMNLRKLSILAITALLLTGISGVSAVHATARTTATGTPLPSTSLLGLITSLINSVGDDTFSTIDLTTLVNSVTPTTPLLTSASAAQGLHYAPMMAAPASAGTSTQHYGPYVTTNDPDSGTCGNDWATDSFDRHLTVFQNKDDGSILIVEQFKNGAFVTPAPASDSLATPNGPSPGACNTSPPPTGNGGTVATGIQGNFHGYLVIPLPAGTTQISNSPFCNATTSTDTECTGTTFIETHFTSCYPASCPVTFSSTTFFFHYSAGDQGLISHEWQNASPDRGGNTGDIRSA